MPLTAEKKKTVFKKFGKSEKDTGNTDAQIAVFTERINELTAHMQAAPKDFSTQRSLIMLVGKRRSLLDYLSKTDIERYRKLIAALNIRK
jgi:small subunit ribosomal protein S15